MSKTYDCERNLSAKVFIGNQMVYSWKCMNLFPDSLATIWFNILIFNSISLCKDAPLPFSKQMGREASESPLLTMFPFTQNVGESLWL